MPKPKKHDSEKAVGISISLPKALHARALLRVQAEGEETISRYIRRLITKDIEATAASERVVGYRLNEDPAPTEGPSSASGEKAIPLFPIC